MIYLSRFCAGAWALTALLAVCACGDGDDPTDDSATNNGAANNGPANNGNNGVANNGGNNGANNGGNNGANNGGNNGPANNGAPVLTQPACAWNQAYHENFEADSIGDILDSARNCYVLLDPFDSDEARVAIPRIKAGGNVVGCYISVGTCEEWREDFDEIAPHCISRAWAEWEGEFFVDTPSEALVAAMGLRVDQMGEWGCDMVEFDNMDWAFDDDSRRMYGFSATADQAVAYNRAICDRVEAQGMACMAKNTREGAAQFGSGTFESYSDDKNWWEQAHLQSFLDDGGLGLIIHYDETDCDGVYAEYRGIYGDGLSFVCEDRALRGYRRYGQ